MVEGVEDAPAPAPPKKPALLRGGMVVCWICTGVLVLFLVVVGRLPVAGSTEITLSGSGLPAAGTKMAMDLVESARLFLIPLLIVSILAAYGLAKDRHWSRWVVMGLLVLGVILIPPPFASTLNYWLSGGFAVFGYWYLYHKPNVVAYYDAIRSRG